MHYKKLLELITNTKNKEQIMWIKGYITCLSDQKLIKHQDYLVLNSHIYSKIQDIKNNTFETVSF